MVRWHYEGIVTKIVYVISLTIGEAADASTNKSLLLSIALLDARRVQPLFIAFDLNNASCVHVCDGGNNAHVL